MIFDLDQYLSVDDTGVPLSVLAQWIWIVEVQHIIIKYT